jgi:hypothetical protein
MGSSPERGNAVISRAIADDGNDTARGLGELDAERGMAKPRPLAAPK